MMYADPFRMVVVPPSAVVPHVMLVPVAIDGAPIRIHRDPFGMMMPNPSGVMFMPPGRIMPYVMVVPITVVARMRNRRRSRKDGCQGRGGEYCSKFHSWYGLEEPHDE